MDAFYIYLFLAFALPAAWLELQNSSCLDLFSRKAPKTQEQAGFRAFRDNYVLVFSLMMAGDWLQGPYVYHLYEVYGFSVKDIGLLFIVGFGSSALLGTLVGALADIWGRKRAALLYVVTYVASCLTKHSRRFWVLLIGRLLGGTATSLLFSAFEAWAVGAHTAAGYDPSLLGDLFTKAVFMGNGLMAILAGLAGNWLVEGLALGPVAPFDAAALVLLVGGGLVAATWGENYGDGGSGGSGGGLAAQFKGAWEAICQDERIALLGAMQALFEGSMYTFVFLWTPALSSGGTALPHGFIFAIFMTASLAGTAAAGQLMARLRLEQFMQGVFWLACASLLVPAAFHLDKAPTNAVAEWHAHQEPLLQRHKQHMAQRPAVAPTPAGVAVQAAGAAVQPSGWGGTQVVVGEPGVDEVLKSGVKKRRGRRRGRWEDSYGGAKPELLQQAEDGPRRQLLAQQQKHQPQHQLQEPVASWANAEDLQQLLMRGRGGWGAAAAPLPAQGVPNQPQHVLTSRGLQQLPMSKSSLLDSYDSEGQSSVAVAFGSASVFGTASSGSSSSAAGRGPGGAGPAARGAAASRPGPVAPAGAAVGASTSAPRQQGLHAGREGATQGHLDTPASRSSSSSSSSSSSAARTLSGGPAVYHRRLQDSPDSDQASSSSSSSSSSEAAGWEVSEETGTLGTTPTTTSSSSKSSWDSGDASSSSSSQEDGGEAAPLEQLPPGTQPQQPGDLPALLPEQPAHRPSGLDWAGRVQLVAFCVFEVVIGLFWPSMMTLRSTYVPEEERATIINIFRIPLNLFVCMILWKVSEYPLGYILALCSMFLAGAAACTARLAHLTHGKGMQARRSWSGPGDAEAPISPVALGKPDGRLGLRGKSELVH